MLIKEVESVVGLSKKSIRYYEQVGLLTPKRTYQNDYREFTEGDIENLKKIKFLRELDISILDIKKLKNKEITLKDCLQNKIEKVKELEENYQKVDKMCRELIHLEQEYDTLEVNKYLEELMILKNGGFTMNKNSCDHSKKIWGAISSSLIFIFLFLFFIGMITYFQLTEVENMPMVLYFFLVGVFVIPMISIVMNLIARIKEIRRGEEDEASKY